MANSVTKEIKSTSLSGVDFLIKEEGLVKRPYLDSVGIPTIGIGMTYYPDTGKKVTLKDYPLTTERAIELFRMMLKIYELAVYSVTRDDINQNNFDAMASLCYNIGVSGFKSSAVVRFVNMNPKDKHIRMCFEMWKNADGKPILLPRRRREADLYFKPVIAAHVEPETMYINQVKFIQTKLRLKPVDGIFGPGTKKAVIDFQKSRGLIADGVVGPQTLQQLNLLP